MSEYASETSEVRAKNVVKCESTWPIGWWVVTIRFAT